MNKNDLVLEPKCLSGDIAFAVSNRGHLIPCCRCDSPHTMDDPHFKKLLDVSVISRENTVDKILATREWLEFTEDLKKNIGPRACQLTCKKESDPDTLRTYTKIDTENAKVIDKFNL